MAGAGKPTPKVQPASLKQWAGIGVVVAVVLIVVAFSWSLKTEMGGLALSLFKIGSVAFGNGYTIVSLLQVEAVEAHPWLTMNQFADGLALGQITPGSILIIATFLGYKMAGFWGGLLATFAIFSPSFAMTLVFTEVFTRIRDLKAVRGALSGVMASFVGLLVVVLLQLGGVALTSPAAFALAGAAFVAVRWFKLDILWVFLGGLVVWGGLLALGLV
jgi:chromate transporter